MAIAVIVLGDAKPRLQNSNANRVLGIIGNRKQACSINPSTVKLANRTSTSIDGMAAQNSEEGVW